VHIEFIRVGEKRIVPYNPDDMYNCKQEA